MTVSYEPHNFGRPTKMLGGFQPFLIFVALAGGSCWQPPLIQFASSTTSPSLFAGTVKLIESRLSDAMARWVIPALSYVVTFRNRTLLIGGMGVANRTSGATAGPGTLYRVGSLTKIFTALAARAAVARHPTLISLDSPVNLLEPRFSILDPFSGRQTGALSLRQLGSHMAGLADGSPCDIDLGPNCTEEQVYARTPEMQLMLPPSTRPQYSNFGFSLLGRSLQNVVKQSYESFVADAVFAELGMVDSGFFFPPAVVQRMAQGGGTRSHFADLSYSNPCGAMYSSVRDLAKFLAWQIGRLEDLQPVYVAPDGESATGMPWEMRRYGKVWSRTKIGNVDGFASSIELVPELGLGVAVLTNNAQMDAHVLTQPIVQLLVETIEADVSQSLAVPSYPVPTAQFLGTWSGEATTLEVRSFDPATGWFDAVLEGSTAGVLQPQSLAPGRFAFVFRSLVVQGALDSWSVETGCTNWMFNGVDGAQVIFLPNASGQLEVMLPGQTNWKTRLTKQS
jgi:CubicO group peptidase (beta-lactamase class C family)